jgi:hypothetical protein
LSGITAAYRKQPTHQLGTLPQKAFSVALLVSSEGLASIFFHYPGSATESGTMGRSKQAGVISGSSDRPFWLLDEQGVAKHTSSSQSSFTFFGKSLSASEVQVGCQYRSRASSIRLLGSTPVSS